MNFLCAICIAFSMFSTIPMPQVEWNKKNMRFMMCAFPLVGLAIWLCEFLWTSLVLFLNKNGFFVSPKISALGFVLLPVLLTGGIHIDGFMDTSDALKSHASTQKKLEILKDSHVGAFAVLACTLYFLSSFVFALELYERIFELQSAKEIKFLGASFFESRLLSAFAVATFSIAKDSGLVHTFSTSSDRRFTAVWCGVLFFALNIFLFIKDIPCALTLCLTNIFAFAVYFFMARKNFKGITGDTAGWFVQIAELFSLIGFVIVNSKQF